MEQMGNIQSEFVYSSHGTTTHSTRDAEQPGSLPEMLYGLSILANLYEIGLAVSGDLSQQELFEHILTHMRRTMRAQDASLLLFNQKQQKLMLVAQQGQPIPYLALSHPRHIQELQQQASRESSTNLALLPDRDHHLLQAILYCHHALIGCILLRVSDEQTLFDERGLLLIYMGNVAALILHHQAQHDEERHALLKTERARIARDLHDGPLQELAHLGQKLEMLQRLLTRGATLEQLSYEITQARSILDSSINTLRSDLTRLGPDAHLTQNLSLSLQALIHHARKQQPECQFEASLDSGPDLSPLTALAFYHLAQEALTNIRKHAHATHVCLKLALHPRHLTLRIADNGVGFHYSQSGPLSPARPGHFGLHMMREHIEGAGGKLYIYSQPGQGTTILATLPT